MTHMKDIIGNYENFLTDILKRITAAGFDLDDFVQIDHLCYRTSTLENYHQKKEELSKVSLFLGENQVNGRPISIFRLKQPIIYQQWRIDALELPAPKEGKPFKDGLEHIELVLYDDIPTFLKKYADKQFDMRAADRGINPEIGLQLGKYSVKFHLLSLPAVVFLEDKLGIKEVKDGQ
jgi:predicted metalloenzyme YecM